MFEFSIDVRGENYGEREGKKYDDTNLDSNHIDTEGDSRRNKLDLRNRLPELHKKTKSSKCSNDWNLNDTYIVTNYKSNRLKKSDDSSLSKEVLKNASLKLGLEKEHAVPILKDKTAKLNRKKKRESTKGENWYNLPAMEITEEIKNDLQVLKMRSVLEKNHFYKKNDIKSISKYFQVGTVVESSADFYSGRIVKSKRKKTLVEELLADAECKNFQKKKYKEIMDVNRKRPKHKLQSKPEKKSKVKN